MTRWEKECFIGFQESWRVGCEGEFKLPAANLAVATRAASQVTEYPYIYGRNRFIVPPPNQAGVSTLTGLNFVLYFLATNKKS
jgi:hypothetical protein